MANGRCYLYLTSIRYLLITVTFVIILADEGDFFSKYLKQHVGGKMIDSTTPFSCLEQRVGDFIYQTIDVTDITSTICFTPCQKMDTFCQDNALI